MLLMIGIQYGLFSAILMLAILMLRNYGLSHDFRQKTRWLIKGIIKNSLYDFCVDKHIRQMGYYFLMTHAL